MGLDISYYSELKLCSEGEQILIPNLKDFINREDCLDTEKPYIFSSGKDFQAGAYRYYGRWRTTLAKITGLDEQTIYSLEVFDNIPFYELINFADNEGTIGPLTSAKLYKDFLLHYNEAENLYDRDGFTLYLDFLEAFKMASNGGAVVFH